MECEVGRIEKNALAAFFCILCEYLCELCGSRKLPLDTVKLSAESSGATNDKNAILVIIRVIRGPGVINKSPCPSQTIEFHMARTGYYRMI